MVTVPALAEAAFLAPVTRHTRRTDIYLSDGTTEWLHDAPVIDGSVSVDYGRDERRALDITFDNIDGVVSYSPTGFWYDKIIKCFRGVEYYDTSALSWKSWETQIGAFMIDTLKESNFPTTVSVSGRDYTKKMLTSKFVVMTTFAQGSSLDTTIKNIALTAGIPNSQTLIPATGKTLGTDFIFDRGISKWEAAKQIADAYGFELYFDAFGILTMRTYLDPVTSPLSYTFFTGEDGNLVTYEKSISDTRLYNHVVVSGESTDTLPVWAEARNDNPDSPTSIGRIGDRLYQYVSSFITTTAQAQDVADRFLGIHSLQEYDFNFSSLMLPWLEVGEVIEFIDPKTEETQPDRFLMDTLTIPLALGPMSGTGKRVTVLG